MICDEPMTIELKIYHCWVGGKSVAETRRAVHRTCGSRPSFEQVRTTFADLSHRYAGRLA